MLKSEKVQRSIPNGPRRYEWQYLSAYSTIRTNNCCGVSLLEPSCSDLYVDPLLGFREIRSVYLQSQNLKSYVSPLLSYGGFEFQAHSPQPTPHPHPALHATDDSSISFASEAPTPINRHHAPPSTRQDLATSSPPAWRPAEWSRSIDVGNDYHLNKSFPTGCGGGGGREEDVTARLYSSASDTDSSAGEAERRHQGTRRARRHNSQGHKDSGRDQRRSELDEAARLLRSQLAAARSQLEQKEIVTRSLQRQLDQVSSSRLVGDAARCY